MWLTSNKVGFVVLLIGFALLAMAIDAGAVDLIKLSNKALNAGVVWLFAGLYNKYWRTKNYETDLTISAHPIAVAVYNGCVWIALAIAVATAF